MPREHRRTWGQGLGVLPAFPSKPREKLPTFTPAQSSPETRKGVEMLRAARNFFIFFFLIGNEHCLQDSAGLSDDQRLRSKRKLPI